MTPAADPGACPVRACTRERVRVGAQLCYAHLVRWKEYLDDTGAAGDSKEQEAWIEHQTPFLQAHMFSLAPLQEAARVEMLYGLQRRDTRKPTIYPKFLRNAVTAVASVPSIALAGHDSGFSRNAPHDGPRGVLAAVQWEVATAFDEFQGIDPARKLVWDLRTVTSRT